MQACQSLLAHSLNCVCVHECRVVFFVQRHKERRSHPSKRQRAVPGASRLYELFPVLSLLLPISLPPSLCVCVHIRVCA